MKFGLLEDSSMMIFSQYQVVFVLFRRTAYIMETSVIFKMIGSTIYNGIVEFVAAFPVP